MVGFSNSQEFKPSGKGGSRPDRLYQLSNKKTELRIFQGDITKTKVDAIVNGMHVFVRECLLSLSSGL